MNATTLVTDNQWTPRPKYARLFISVTLMLWLLPSWKLISHTSQNPVLFQRYSFPYFAMLLSYGGVLLLGLIALYAIPRRVDLVAWGIANLQRRPWLLTLVLVGSTMVAWAVIRGAPTAVFRFSLLALILLADAIIIFLGGSGDWWNLTIVALAAAIVAVPLLTDARLYGITRQPDFPGIERAAERLAALTTPDDKIFALSDMHEFFLAERYPYPPLMNIFFNLVISSDTEAVLRFNHWNYALAVRWLDEADVVVLSDVRLRELPTRYIGYPGSGQDVVDLLDEVLAQNFVLVEEAPGSSYGGTLYIYQRRTP